MSLASPDFRARLSELWPGLMRLTGQSLRVAVVVAGLALLGAGLADPRVQEALAPVPQLRPLMETSIRQLQIAEDARTVWVTSLPCRLRNVDLATGRVLIDLPVPKAHSPSPLGTSDGFQVVFCNDNGQLMVQPLGYDRAPIALPRQRDAKIDRFAVSPCSDLVALATTEALELCSLTNSDHRCPIVEQSLRCNALAWTPDGTQLLVVDQDGWLSLRDGRTLVERARVATQIESGGRTHWSQNGRFALAYGSYGPIAVWDARSPAAEARHLDFDYRCAAALSPDGGQIAVCDAQRQLWLIDVADPTDRIGLDRLPALANAICYTPEGDRLLVGTLNGELLCWSLREERLLWTVVF